MFTVAEMNTGVTIIIPTYNRADYLQLTIASALEQTWPNVQVLVISDASTDGTSQMMERYADNPRVTYIQHPKNIGMAANWKSGIAAVQTEFYCLLNDDDLIEQQFVEKLVRPLLENKDLILAFCDHHVIDENGLLREKLADQLSERHGRKKLTDGLVKDFGLAAVVDRGLHISCTLFRKEFAPANFIDELSGGFACGWLFYQSYRTGHGAWYVKERLANYRIHSGNMLGNERWETYLAEGQIYWCHRMLKDNLPEPFGKCVRLQVAEIFSSYAAAWLRLGKRQEALALFQESLALRKRIKPYIGAILCKMGPIGSIGTRVFWKITRPWLAHKLHSWCWPLPLVSTYQ